MYQNLFLKSLVSVNLWNRPSWNNIAEWIFFLSKNGRKPKTAFPWRKRSCRACERANSIVARRRKWIGPSGAILSRRLPPRALAPPHSVSNAPAVRENGCCVRCGAGALRPENDTGPSCPRTLRTPSQSVLRVCLWKKNTETGARSSWTGVRQSQREDNVIFPGAAGAAHLHLKVRYRNTTCSPWPSPNSPVDFDRCHSSRAHWLENFIGCRKHRPDSKWDLCQPKELKLTLNV